MDPVTFTRSVVGAKQGFVLNRECMSLLCSVWQINASCLPCPATAVPGLARLSFLVP
ncbi:unnamed protein product [Ectocarpus sp. 12 AP-2014]